MAKMTGKVAKLELNAGKKAWITKQRNQVVAEAPKSKKCPKCGHKRDTKFFGVRTFKETNAKGEVKFRFGLQSYCVDCRALPTKEKKVAKSPARKAAGSKVRKLLNEGKAQPVAAVKPAKRRRAPKAQTQVQAPVVVAEEPKPETTSAPVAPTGAEISF